MSAIGAFFLILITFLCERAIFFFFIMDDLMKYSSTSWCLHNCRVWGGCTRQPMPDTSWVCPSWQILLQFYAPLPAKSNINSSIGTFQATSMRSTWCTFTTSAVNWRGMGASMLHRRRACTATAYNRVVEVMERLFRRTSTRLYLHEFLYNE